MSFAYLAHNQNNLGKYQNPNIEYSYTFISTKTGMFGKSCIYDIAS